MSQTSSSPTCAPRSLGRFERFIKRLSVLKNLTALLEPVPGYRTRGQGSLDLRGQDDGAAYTKTPPMRGREAREYPRWSTCGHAVMNRRAQGSLSLMPLSFPRVDRGTGSMRRHPGTRSLGDIATDELQVDLARWMKASDHRKGTGHAAEAYRGPIAGVAERTLDRNLGPRLRSQDRRHIILTTGSRHLGFEYSP